MIINVAICPLLLLLLSRVKAQMRITFKQLIRDLRVLYIIKQNDANNRVESGKWDTENRRGNISHGANEIDTVDMPHNTSHNYVPHYIVIV